MDLRISTKLRRMFVYAPLAHQPDKTKPAGILTGGPLPFNLLALACMALPRPSRKVTNSDRPSLS
jgi:hypothetical protein